MNYFQVRWKRSFPARPSKISVEWCGWALRSIGCRNWPKDLPKELQHFHLLRREQPSLVRRANGWMARVGRCWPHEHFLRLMTFDGQRQLVNPLNLLSVSDGSTYLHQRRSTIEVMTMWRQKSKMHLQKYAWLHGSREHWIHWSHLYWTLRLGALLTVVRICMISMASVETQRQYSHFECEIGSLGSQEWAS